MSPPGLYYQEENEQVDLKQQWKFIKDLVHDYVSTKGKYKKMKSLLVRQGFKSPDPIKYEQVHHKESSRQDQYSSSGSRPEYIERSSKYQ